MIYACPNCLQAVSSPGLCNICSALTEGFGNWIETEDAVAASFPEYMDWHITVEGGPDELWIRQLRERRMESYARARRRARRGL